MPGRLYPIQLEYIAAEKEEEGRKGRPPEGSRGRRGDGPGHRHQGGRSGPGRQAQGGSNQGKDRSQDSIDPKPYLKLLQRLDSEIPSSQRGDMLIFVSGMADMVALSDGLRPYAMEGRRWLILPLHRCVLECRDADGVSA